MVDHSAAAGSVLTETVKPLSDPFRSFLYGESEAHNLEAWRPPVYDAVNAVFEDGRTQVCLLLTFSLLIYRLLLQSRSGQMYNRNGNKPLEAAVTPHEASHEEADDRNFLRSIMQFCS
ncbi:hypothetical protein Mapa_000355 [Marchantia paleacea]|nr:hypothetical protein Mapa_000355 [Marchantia paleacea]